MFKITNITNGIISYEHGGRIVIPSVKINGEEYLLDETLSSFIGRTDEVKEYKVYDSAIYVSNDYRQISRILTDEKKYFICGHNIVNIKQDTEYFKRYRVDGDYTLICEDGKYDFQNALTNLPPVEYENMEGGTIEKYNIIPGMIRERKYMIYSYGEDGKIEIEGVEKGYNELMIGGVTVALEIGNERYGIVGRDKNMILLKKISNSSRE